MSQGNPRGQGYAADQRNPGVAQGPRFQGAGPRRRDTADEFDSADDFQAYYEVRSGHGRKWYYRQLLFAAATMFCRSTCWGVVNLADWFPISFLLYAKHRLPQKLANFVAE